MAGLVLILEDDPSRVAVMRRVIAEVLPGVEPVCFDNAMETIEFVRTSQARIILISLDHDLGASRLRDGEWVDPGDGRDVASFLSGLPPACPVIVHSSNYQMVPVMVEMLREAGWVATIVTPHSQLALAWIEGEWRGEIEMFLRNGLISDV